MTKPETPDELFGHAVKELREQRGWSMSEFAAVLSDAGLSNFHPTTVSRLERGERPLRLSEAVVIARTFEVSIDGLVGWSAGPDLTIPGAGGLPELAKATLRSLALTLMKAAEVDEQEGDRK